MQVFFSFDVDGDAVEMLLVVFDVCQFVINSDFVEEISPESFVNLVLVADTFKQIKEAEQELRSILLNRSVNFLSIEAGVSNEGTRVHYIFVRDKQPHKYFLQLNDVLFFTHLLFEEEFGEFGVVDLL
jgi:hypothetical protein